MWSRQETGTADTGDAADPTGYGADFDPKTQTYAATIAVDNTSNLPMQFPKTLGFANNNPGNLRYIAHNAWQGQIGNNKGYGVYDTLSNGVRALGRQLAKDIANGADTITKLINSWAPPSENNTLAYIYDVSQRLGVDSNAPLNLAAFIPELSAAVIIHENGSNPLDEATLSNYLNS